jgi:hypothetical protein
MTDEKKKEKPKDMWELLGWQAVNYGYFDKRKEEEK